MGLRMRIFKKRVGMPPEPKSEPRGSVVDDVVYDEHGDAIFSHREDIPNTLLHDTMPEPEAVADALRDDEPATHFTEAALDDDIFDRVLAEDSFSETEHSEDILSDDTVMEEPAYDEIDNVEVDSDEPVISGFDMDDDMPAADLTVSIPDDTPTIRVAKPEQRRHAVEPDLLHKRVNLGELRMDVARITSDIQSGERLYQRAQQRVESLMQFVERAEVDFSLLNRLEPENRRLKARNRVLEAENDSTTHERRRLENDLAKARDEAEAAKANLETTRARLAAVTGQVGDRDREITRLTEEMEQAGLKLERTQTSVEVESRENVLLRDQLSDLSGRLDEVTSERMELAKIVESLKIDCDDFRDQREQALTDVADLRVALATAQKVNGEMKTQMVSLHEEIKGFKTQYEFNVISREDRIANLENRIADLTKQLAIKEDVAKNALADVSQLRKSRSTQDLERERLERIIESQQRQIDDAQAQIQRSTDSMAQLDKRYNDVASALSVYQKRLNSAATDIDEQDWADPLAPPPPFDADGREVAPPPPSGDESITPDNVEDMIMDYKLGLRSQIG